MAGKADEEEAMETTTVAAVVAARELSPAEGAVVAARDWTLSLLLPL